MVCDGNTRDTTRHWPRNIQASAQDFSRPQPPTPHWHIRRGWRGAGPNATASAGMAYPRRGCTRAPGSQQGARCSTRVCCETKSRHARHRARDTRRRLRLACMCVCSVNDACLVRQRGFGGADHNECTQNGPSRGPLLKERDGIMTGSISVTLVSHQRLSGPMCTVFPTP